MNEHDHEAASKIVRLLNEGADRLDPGAQARLQAARRVALSHFRENTAPAWTLAWTGNAFSRFTEQHVFGVRYLIPTLVLVIGLAGIFYFQNMPATDDPAGIDIELLTGELPINAYLDRGFDAWLKRSLR